MTVAVRSIIRPMRASLPDPGRTLGRAGQFAVVALVVAGAVIANADPTKLGLLWYIPFAAVGALLVIRRPRTSIGWILLALSWAHAIVTIRVRGTAEQFANATFDLPDDLFLVVHNASIGTLLYLYLVLATVFPSGGFAPGRLGRVGRWSVGLGAIAAAAGCLMPTINAELIGNPVVVEVRNPIALLPGLAIWRPFTPATAGDPLLILGLMAAVSLVIRARRSSGIERLQLRWLAASIAALVLTVISGFVMTSVVPGSGEGFAWTPATIAFLTVPLAVGVAVLRYRLFEIDRIVSRTLGWALVTSALLMLFAGCVVGLQALLADVTQGQTIAVAGATLAAAAAFQPVRQRLQSMVDHRFNRAKYDAERTTRAFGEHLRGELDLVSLRRDIAGVVNVAFRPAGVRVWIRDRERRSP